MKAVSDYVFLYADRAGVFRMRVETECVTIKTNFSVSIARVNGEDPNIAEDASVCAEVRLDCKRLFRFLHCHHVPPENVVIVFAEGTVIMHVLCADDLYMTYWIPTSAA